ncbi:acyl-homoserine-lactone synthase [Phaeobacter sp. QD34_3]|uniref:acyl-homoserine-lactone synthase n=1 Tax=unclassified Phaeobacter TaxID=2621772 RepID=UPI00237F0211|nr:MULTISPECIES: acyl-homoserine-lactone synthase [unclassified Phaeobacter]MDE4134451.1 acyl-homoserine-lactone synthase [Phaeobacter sp. QD34_3]MDE4138159.1 acyl-homoserine-lactone synthase [Phaeobacter sp. QD34_24]
MLNTLIVDDRNMGLYGGLLHEQFRKRHALFAQQLGWDVPRSVHIERDQYDRDETVYVLVEEAGELIGYARLLPTTATVAYGSANFSYLVRDACQGKLPGIPSDILGEFEPPTSNEVWEMTRVEAQGRKSLIALFDAANGFLVSQGAVSAITFTRRSFSGILNSLGYETKILGRDVDYGGKPYCTMSTRLKQSAAGA